MSGGEVVAEHARMGVAEHATMGVAEHATMGVAERAGMVVAGFGFRGAATVASLRDALCRAGGGAVQAVAAPADKSDAPCLVALAGELRVPVIGVTPEALQAAATLSEAPRVRDKRGTGSVAEAAALCGAGPGALLTGVRSISGDRLATAAIAVSGRDGGGPHTGGPQTGGGQGA